MTGVFGLCRRLGLGFVGFCGSVGRTGKVPSPDQVRGHAFPANLPCPPNYRCPSGLPRYDVDSHPRLAIRPLWAFPAATREEPGPTCRMVSKCPEADATWARSHAPPFFNPALTGSSYASSPWCGREPRLGEAERAGISFRAPPGLYQSSPMSMPWPR